MRGELQGEGGNDGEGDVMMSVGSLLLCSSVTVLECYSVTAPQSVSDSVQTTGWLTAGPLQSLSQSPPATQTAHSHSGLTGGDNTPVHGVVK